MIVVSAVSACSPVGLHAASTCAALRGGIANIHELFTHTVTGEVLDREPMRGGRVPTEWLDGAPEEEEWPGHERFGLRPPPALAAMVAPGVERVLELLGVSLAEIRERGLAELDPSRYRVYVGLNEAEPVLPVRDALVEQLGGDESRFVLEASGRAAGLSLLRRALDDLAANRTEGVLLGSVDSLIRAPMAQRLDAARRLKSDTEPQGIIPGEGAAFVYLESAAKARGAGRTPLARVLSAAIGAEPSAGRDVPNRGTGLTDALRGAREDAALTAMPLLVCDLNGERPRALEWMLAATRALGELHGDHEVWHAADCIGDAGAGAGALNLVWAATALSRGYAPHPRALVWGASDGALRAAAVLEREG